MDPRTGNIIPGGLLDELKTLAEESEADEMEARLDEFKEMVIPPTTKQLMKMRVGKYDPCPCNSGKKFKWCCWTGRKDGAK